MVPHVPASAQVQQQSGSHYAQNGNCILLESPLQLCGLSRLQIGDTHSGRKFHFDQLIRREQRAMDRIGAIARRLDQYADKTVRQNSTREGFVLTNDLIKKAPATATELFVAGIAGMAAVRPVNCVAQTSARAVKGGYGWRFLTICMRHAFSPCAQGVVPSLDTRVASCAFRSPSRV